MIHALIVGERGVGKSTLIRRVLQELNCPVSGFETVRLDTRRKDGFPVYLFAAGTPHVPSEEKLIGLCNERQLEARRAPFDAFASELLVPVPAGSVRELDELGTLENVSPDFQRAVLTCLDGPVPVIAAVKPKDTPFLRAIRSHPDCRCFYLTPENRDSLYPEVLAFMRRSLEQSLC